MNNGAQQCICVRSTSFQIDKILFHAKVVDEPIFMPGVCVPDVHTIVKLQCHLLSRFCDLKYVLSSFNIEGYFHPAPGHKKFTFDRIVFFWNKNHRCVYVDISFQILSLKLQFRYIMYSIYVMYEGLFLRYYFFRFFLLLFLLYLKVLFKLSRLMWHNGICFSIR